MNHDTRYSFTFFFSFQLPLLLLPLLPLHLSRSFHPFSANSFCSRAKGRISSGWYLGGYLLHRQTLYFNLRTQSFWSKMLLPIRLNLCPFKMHYNMASLNSIFRAHLFLSKKCIQEDAKRRNTRYHPSLTFCFDSVLETSPIFLGTIHK